MVQESGLSEDTVMSQRATTKAIAAVLETFADSLQSTAVRGNMYRGKNLGTSVSDEQRTAIKNGDFSKFFIGDYWQAANNVWRIADMDYFYNCGDTVLKNHHLVIVPDDPLYTSKVNQTNTTTTGYKNSWLRKNNLTAATETIEGIFGDLVLTHREALSTGFKQVDYSGYEETWEWTDCKVEIPNELMLYGCYIWGMHSYTATKKQLALFRLNPKTMNKLPYSWLRDISTNQRFCCFGRGRAVSGSATDNNGVRPYFVLGS